MAKKHKSHEKHVNHVIQSLKDLGVGGRDTLARLATTVKADAPTLILGAASHDKKSDRKRDVKPTLALRARASLSRMAYRIHPAGEPAAQRQVARELKRLNKRVKKAHQGPKVRKSRLPYVVAMTVLMALGGGYWVLSKVSLPSVHVAQYLDYRKWLDHTAGRETHHVIKAAPPAPAARTEIVRLEPVSQPKVKTVLPQAPRVLVYSSSKGAVGAKKARIQKRQAKIEPARHGHAKVKTASFRRLP